MPKEKECFRDNLERLCELFPNKELLNKKEVADFLGVNYRTVTKILKFKGNYISKVVLARELS